MILRSLIKSFRAPSPAPDADAKAPAPTQAAWRTKPRYDVDQVCAFKQLDDPARPLRFAELDLDGRTLRYCISSPVSEWRVKTLFTKEPGTIDWLHSFNPGEAFVDIGANVGMYSLYAGVIAKARVFSFEPESQNYAELCRSIFFNESARRDMVAWCAAIGEAPVEVSRLLIRDLHTGDSFHDFGEPSRNYAAAERFAQGSIGFSLDHLIEMGAVPEPDHIKIDVDGFEPKVIAGARRIIEGRKLRSLLIEVNQNLADHRQMVAELNALGYRHDPAQVAAAERKQGPFIGCAEYVFKR